MNTFMSVTDAVGYRAEKRNNVNNSTASARFAGSTDGKESTPIGKRTESDTETTTDDPASTGSVNTGSVNTGSVNTGSVNTGPTNTHLYWPTVSIAQPVANIPSTKLFTPVVSVTKANGKANGDAQATRTPTPTDRVTRPTGSDAVLQPQETLDLDLQLSPQEGAYAVRVLTSPAGQANGDFSVPFAETETGEFVQEIMPSTRPLSRLAVQALMKEHGGRLFDALFQNDLLVCLERSFDEVRRRNATLRIKLRLTDVPELLNLPWEYLFHRRRNLFLSQSTTSSLVHFLELPDPVSTLTVALPLRMLVVIANPTDLQAVDVEREWTNIQGALAELIERGMVIVDRLPNATLPELQSALRRHDYHVIHFVGHGDFDKTTGQGHVIFADAQGQSNPMPGEVLAQLLHNERTLRLAVLNACEGTQAEGIQASNVSPFAGVAQLLVQQGVPAVIAMRHPISDEAAIAFSHEFYAALADGYTVDAAVTEGRVAVATRMGNGEWGTPQLIMHAQNGRLWQVAAKVDDPPIDGAAISADLGVLTQLMQRTAVRDMVATYRADFTAAEHEIDILSNYKFLHDLLHKLQFRCYNVITQEARRFPTDDLAFDNLLNYEVTLQDIVANLQGVMEEAQFPATETSWVNDLLDAQQLLRRALDTMESEALRRVVWLMRRVLALQPSNVNHRLSSAARALRLDTIVGSLRAIRTELETVQVADPQLDQLTSGIQELEQLNTQLNQLVTEHDQWQDVQRILGRIEDMMVYDLTELEFSWPDLSIRVTTLCTPHKGDWVDLFYQDGEQLQKALADQNPVRIRSYFQRYRQRAGNRFFQVDTQLKDLCTELRKVGESLATILKLME